MKGEPCGASKCLLACRELLCGNVLCLCVWLSAPTIDQEDNPGFWSMTYTIWN